MCGVPKSVVDQEIGQKCIPIVKKKNRISVMDHMRYHVSILYCSIDGKYK